MMDRDPTALTSHDDSPRLSFPMTAFSLLMIRPLGVSSHRYLSTASGLRINCAVVTGCCSQFKQTTVEMLQNTLSVASTTGSSPSCSFSTSCRL